MDQRTDRPAGSLPVPRIVSGDVARAGEQPATVVRVDMTPAQLAHLIERAGRPIVLQGPQASPAPYLAPAAGGTGHPGINVTYPASSGYGYALPVNVAPLPTVAETRTWAPVAFTASAAAFLGGPLLALLAGSPLAAAIVCLAGFAGGARSLALLLRTEQ